MSVHEVWSEDELDRALATLYSDVDNDEPGLAGIRAELVGTVATQPTPPSRHRGRWVVAAAAVAATVAGLLVAQTVSFGNHPPAASAAAAALNSSADNIRASDPPLGPGQYRYIGTHAWWMTGVFSNNQGFAYLSENLVEIWAPADPTQEWLLRSTVTGERTWLKGTEAEARAAGVSVDDGGQPRGEWRARCDDVHADDANNQHCSTPGADRLPTSRWLAGLPRDPKALNGRLRPSAPSDARLFGYAATMLRSGLIPADLRGALYRVLAQLPGLKITDRQANLDGRTGIAYALGDDDSRSEIIIDQATGEFIGERMTTTRDVDGKLYPDLGGIKAGTVLNYSSVTTAVVDSMGARPPA